MEGHSGSVFEGGSRANQEVLIDLREILEHLGSRVVKKVDKEDTLRAYPERLYSKAQQRLVEAWAEIHRAELLQDWDLLQSGRPPVKIEPLR